MFIISWLLFCGLVGMFAQVRRHRNGVGWFFLSIVVSPLIGVLALLILEPLPQVVGGAVPPTVSTSTAVTVVDHKPSFERPMTESQWKTTNNAIMALIVILVVLFVLQAIF
jgi:hypothetical protein